VLAAVLAMALLGGVVVTRAVTEPKNDFRFSILGDRTGGATAEIYGRVWREIDLLHPDFVINVGDTIQGGSDEKAPSEWTELRPLWARYSHYPHYFTPGNHDVWSEVSRQIYERESGRASQYSFNYQDAHFVVLDNSRTADLSEEQLDFLERDLEANKDRRPKFVFFHRPFWIPLLMLAQGHGFREGRFYHHVWGRVKGGKVQLTVKEVDGAKGAGRMFRAEDWDEKGPKFEVEDPAAVEQPQT
jgi:hypothetical protein